MYQAALGLDPLDLSLAFSAAANSPVEPQPEPRETDEAVFEADWQRRVGSDRE